MSTAAPAPVLEVSELDVVYPSEDGLVQALRRVDLVLREREIVGVVGESGCGKSTLAAALLQLLPKSSLTPNGSVRLRGRDLIGMSDRELRALRGPEIAMIFQDPSRSLNPTFTIGQQMVDIQRAHRREPRAELRRRAVDMLGKVGMPDPEDRLHRYPHQFSGGMRQRIMIATALLLEPAVLVADEPTSALDVTLAAQILELLRMMRDERGTSIILVSHDLGTIAETCDRVVVMYAGQVVEHGTVDELFAHPRHPYTIALLNAIPSHERRGESLARIPGRVPPLSALPPGCSFENRCGFAEAVCQSRGPVLVPSGAELVRCHPYDPGSGYEGPRPDGGAS